MTVINSMQRSGQYLNALHFDATFGDAFQGVLLFTFFKPPMYTLYCQAPFQGDHQYFQFLRSLLQTPMHLE